MINTKLIHNTTCMCNYHIIINSIYTCLYIIYVTYGYEYSDTQSHAALFNIVLKATDVSIF